ncbi:MAG: ISL3 family transposase [Actinomycetota bacterium]|nr:ISL3 family transposase [Actinomycetota bacterium]
MAVSPLSPAPAEVRFERLDVAGSHITIIASTVRVASPCPDCGVPSEAVHSRYTRTLADLPWHGVAVRLVLAARKFFCRAHACPRRIFTERLPGTAAPYARRTGRLTDALRAIGFASGGAAGARLAAALGMAASASTVLRRLRDAVCAPDPEPNAVRAVGVDEWAWRKGMRYGTIVVDLERRRVLDLLPDREPETVAAWLHRHPALEVVSRDRAGAFAEAARRGAPQAVQVADRFHLVKNVGEAVQRILARHARVLREVAQELHQQAAASPSPAVPSVLDAAAEHRPSPEAIAAAESRSRRQLQYEQVLALRRRGFTLEEIGRRLGMGTATVHRWVHTDGFPERACHRRRADAVAADIRRRWEAGCRNATALWDALRAEGFTGSKRTIQREIVRLGLAAAPPLVEPPLTVRPPSPRHVAWLFGRDDTAGTAADSAFLAALCARSSALSTVRATSRGVSSGCSRRAIWRATTRGWPRPTRASCGASRAGCDPMMLPSGPRSVPRGATGRRRGRSIGSSY